MRSYSAAFMMALVLAAMLTPLARRLALTLGAISRPGGRHVNQRAVPRLGGVAIAISVLAPLVTLFLVESGVALHVRADAQRAVVLLVGGLLLCAVGAVDDVRGVRARYKFVAQLAAALLAFHFGLRIDAVELPYVGILNMGVFALPVTLAWIIGVTNAVNLIDGLDGLAAGVVFFAAATSFLVALFGYQSTGQVVVALLMASLMGALIGFLFYNFNPARIFMGDSGSYFLGYLLATSSLLAPMQKASTTVALLVPMVALGVPIFDTLLSVLRRYLARRPLFAADREHIHHRLLDRGITHRKAVLVLYSVSVALAGAATAIALARDWVVGLALVGACAVLIGLVRFLGYFRLAHHSRFRRAERSYDALAQALRLALPGLLDRLGSCRSEAQLEEALTHLAQHVGFAHLTVTHGGTTKFLWGKHTSRTDVSPVRFSLSSDGKNQICFGLSDGEVANPGSEILLQLVADVYLANARRLESVWASGASGETSEPAISSSPSPAWIR